MPLIRIVLGVGVLLFGRPLYWALVAVLGFFVGFDLVQDLEISDSQILQFLVPIGAGILAAGIAILAQWLAFALIGFLSGSYLVIAAMEQYNLAASDPQLWIIGGGILGAVVALLLVDWAVILLSSLVGASLITKQLPIQPEVRMPVVLGLALVGMIYQRNRLNRQNSPKK